MFPVSGSLRFSRAEGGEAARADCFVSRLVLFSSLVACSLLHQFSVIYSFQLQNICEHDGVLYIFRNGSSGQRSVQSGLGSSDRETEVRNCSLSKGQFSLSLDDFTDVLSLDRFFCIKDKPNVTTEMWEKFR